MTTDLTNTLSKFCGSSFRYPKIVSPFWQHGVLCATDSKVCVLVDKEVAGMFPAVTAQEPDIVKFALRQHAIPKQWHPWPKLPKCICETTLGIASDCCDCDDGKCNRCDCGKEHDCGDCGGKGIIYGPCALCRVKFGNCEICPSIYRRVALLPDLTWATTGKSSDPVAFRFAGGIGLMMPLYKEAAP